jgi:hypothetical protein
VEKESVLQGKTNQYYKERQMNITRKKEFVLLENRLILPGKTNQVRDLV